MLWFSIKPVEWFQIYTKKTAISLRSHIAKIKINQNCKTHPQIFDTWCKNVRWKCKNFKKIFTDVLFWKVKLSKMASTKTNKTWYRFNTFFIIISVLFNDNLEAKIQRYITRAIHETRGRKKLKKALCLPIYQPRYVKRLIKWNSRKLSISRSKMGGS